MRRVELLEQLEDAGEGGAEDVGLPPTGRYAQLRSSTELTVSFPLLARVRGMAAITATGTSNTDSSVSPDVRPFPATIRSRPVL